MPSMYQIYEHHAREYDALVSHEDYESHLHDRILERFDWHGAVVVEAGIGTGRVTRSYIDLADEVFGFDRSAHMLKQAADNLAPWAEKLRLDTAVNDAFPVPDGIADLFIEGWAFGHTAMDRPEETQAVVRDLVGEAVRVTKESGTIVLIETLGTNTDTPRAPHPALARFYQELEQAGFTRDVIRTDYRFDSADQAAELCGFFFGEEMRRAVLQRLATLPSRGDVIIPEHTGMWVRRSADRPPH
jgi:ubiquinone/menaquinone biosynthesis C-methylase UbiE